MGFFFALFSNQIILVSDEYQLSHAGVIGAYQTQPILRLGDTANMINLLCAPELTSIHAVPAALEPYARLAIVKRRSSWN